MVPTTFQFLIGSLSTSREGWEKGRQREFQFLIGSLSTGFIMRNAESFRRFQFLIGSLSTARRQEVRWNNGLVSIPYR